MARLIPFPRRPIKPPGTPLTAEQREELRAEDRRRMFENIAALVFVIGLLALSFWVIDRVAAYSQNVSCLQFRLKNCR